jgi:hypothetical protein
MYPEPCYGRVDLCEEILPCMGVFGLRVNDICATKLRSNDQCVYIRFSGCILLFWRGFLGTGGMERAEEQLRLESVLPDSFRCLTPFVA